MSGLEFYVPDPNEKPAEVAKEVNGEADALGAALGPPQLEVELPQVRKPDKPDSIIPSKNVVHMASRALEDPNDPSVLLQGMLGRLPGVNANRAADMAFNADMALNNLGVRAERMAELERRRERREKKG